MSAIDDIVSRFGQLENDHVTPWILDDRGCDHYDVVDASGTPFLAVHCTEGGDEEKLDAAIEAINRTVVAKIRATLEGIDSTLDPAERSSAIGNEWNKRREAFTDPGWLESFILKPEEIDEIDKLFVAHGRNDLSIKNEIIKLGKWLLAKQEDPSISPAPIRLKEIIERGYLKLEDLGLEETAFEQIMHDFYLKSAKHFLQLARGTGEEKAIDPPSMWIGAQVMMDKGRLSAEEVGITSEEMATHFKK
ncbi:MAG: hypothetical protein WC285_02200 [Candidatus Gracilibacteria bacterium]|jgi:hypothetical protein